MKKIWKKKWKNMKKNEKINKFENILDFFKFNGNCVNLKFLT